MFDKATTALCQSLQRRAHRARSFVLTLTLTLVFLGCSGPDISLWPHVIPPFTTIWKAAGPPQSLGFALFGALLINPVILVYLAWGHWMFRGKVPPGEEYR